MELDDLSYEMNVLDSTRIQPLLKQVRNKGIKFKYFITIPYYYRNTDYNSVLLDNKGIRENLRTVFGSGVRMWFFIEKHLDPGSRHYGGFHRHLLLEKIPADTWNHPSDALMEHLLNVNPELLFGGEVSDRDQINVINHVLRLHESVPNGSGGLVTKEIFVLNRLLAYCSKQWEKILPAYESIDPTNSDLDISYLLKNKQDGTSWKTRSQTLPNGFNRSLRTSVV